MKFGIRLYTRDSQVFQKSRSHLKIIGFRKVTLRKFLRTRKYGNRCKKFSRSVDLVLWMFAPLL